MDINCDDFNKIVVTSDLVKQQLVIFLSTRAAHENKEGTIVTDGECEYDTYQGIDYDYIFNAEISDNLTKNYIQSQITKYFSDKIKKITDFTLTNNTVSRTCIISFSYVLSDNLKDTLQITIGG